jgi:hypothetical protein
MRQTQRTLKTLSIVTLTLLTAACGNLPPHNNTLIFAVHRKVGIDVTPTSGTNAGLTVGYSSNEFAWVPLWANDADGKPFTDCDSENKAINTSLMNGETKIPEVAVQRMSMRCAKTPKFVASDDGKDDKNKDSYSVFASFGGDLNAGSGTENTVGAKFASFFATGVAAQHLAENDPGQLLGSSTGTKSRKHPTPEQLAKNLSLQWLRKSADGENVSGQCIAAMLKDIDSSIRDTLSKDLDKYPPETANNLIFNALEEKAKSSLPKVGKHAADLTTRWGGEQHKHNAVAKEDKKDIPAKEVQAQTRNALCPAAQKS